MQPVVILGAGINGAAVARDLALNGIPVVMIESGDIAQGATSRSSRLIHGGLRYLEYRDLALVRESLAERERLLQTASQFVRPLCLRIPVRRRFGGLVAAAVRFCGLSGTRFGAALLRRCHSPRGLIAVRFGLWLYDLLAKGSSLPRHSLARSVGKAELWQCSYWDAQLEFPERFVLSLLHDAQAIAEERGVEFQVLTRHRARLADDGLMIESVESAATDGPAGTAERHALVFLRPAIVINATGAWGDLTLQSLGAETDPLFAGTRGSHLFTTYEPLRQAVGDCGIYAEAGDGRLVFILPLGRGVLIGTTDLPHPGSPSDAVASDEEVTYLLDMVDTVLPGVGLRREHVVIRHAGVRPLPQTSSQTAAAIPRGHSIHWSTANNLRIATLIGGKLTTCRQLAEEVTDAVLDHLNQARMHSTISRSLPGSGVTGEGGCDRIGNAVEAATKTSPPLSGEQVQSMQRLVGDRIDEISATPEFTGVEDGAASVSGTTIPRGFVRWSIAREWVSNLNDLVERRLMLIFETDLQRETLEELAGLLVEAGRLEPAQRDAEVDRCTELLQRFQGKSVLLETD